MSQSRVITFSRGTRVIIVIMIEGTAKTTTEESEATSTRFLAKKLFECFKEAEKWSVRQETKKKGL